ncbi:MAG: hypothetical protein O2966_07680 [Proteobacteria bacterium]|nr:hypothetical protein [Pseudomonadota bacterium]
MSKRQHGKSQETASAIAAISERSGRRIEQGERPETIEILLKALKLPTFVRYYQSHQEQALVSEIKFNKHENKNQVKMT